MEDGEWSQQIANGMGFGRAMAGGAWLLADWFDGFGSGGLRA
jgi:hypothetical protein